MASSPCATSPQRSDGRLLTIWHALRCACIGTSELIAAMKMETNASADSLIEYLNLHTPILTDQGIDVRAFIDRLTALKNNPAQPIQRAARKSRSVKK